MEWKWSNLSKTQSPFFYGSKFLFWFWLLTKYFERFRHSNFHSNLFWFLFWFRFRLRIKDLHIWKQLLYEPNHFVTLWESRLHSRVVVGLSYWCPLASAMVNLLYTLPMLETILRPKTSGGCMLMTLNNPIYLCFLLYIRIVYLVLYWLFFKKI